MADGNSYTFNNVTAGKDYTLSITNGEGKTVSSRLTFTTLPVVCLYGNFDYDYKEGSITVQEPDKATYALHNMKAKWRGGITNGNSNAFMAKKSTSVDPFINTSSQGVSYLCIRL